MPRWNLLFNLPICIFFEQIRLVLIRCIFNRNHSIWQSYSLYLSLTIQLLALSVTYLWFWSNSFLTVATLHHLIIDRKLPSHQENHRSLILLSSLRFQSESWGEVKGFTKPGKNQQVNLHSIVSGKLLQWKGLAESLQLLIFELKRRGFSFKKQDPYSSSDFLPF